MEEPDFNEDDLINDYMAYGEEPPDDDEYLEEMQEEAMEEGPTRECSNESKVSNPPQQRNNHQSEQANQTRGGTFMMDLDAAADHVDNDDDDGNNVNTAEESDTDRLNDYISRQNAESNIYSFERFNSRTDWRSTPTSPNSIYRSKPAGSRRSENNNYLNRIMMRTTRKAPEARLMELVHKKQTEMKGLSMKHSKSVLRSPVEGKQTQPLMLGDGNRVYITIKKDPSETKSLDSSNGTRLETTKTTALGVSMTELKRRSERIMRRRNKSNEHDQTISTNNTSGQLWVDKHAPSSFPHLLSDERTNREVLRAIRAWDPFVFGRDSPARPQNFWQNNAEMDPSPENKNDKRPDEKNRVILLAGPPGVGKTTLAHIIARHAGYRPLEVNASDERSASVLTDRVKRAMESSTINFNKNHPDYGRPNCLILDEIDGADAKGAVQSLVEIIRAEIPPKGAKQKNTYLRRPIIFICNHKYASSLRPLLPFARHFNVDSPSPARLVARLKAVLSHENKSITAAGSLLHQLVVSSGGDIRSCLYTLQFASAESKDSMEFSQALTTSLSGTGLKDHRNDVASTVTAVFRKPKNDRILGLAENDRASVSSVIDAALGLGDVSALINSIFTNLLRVPYIDPTLDRCAVAHELLSSTDLCRSENFGSMDFCAPSTTAAIHLLCRVELKPDLSFSAKEIADNQYRQSANIGLLQRFSEGLSPKSRTLKFQDSLSSEVIPQLIWILSAGEGSNALCRPSSSLDIMTKLERESLEQHVAVLHSLGLTYVADHDQETEKRSTYVDSSVGKMRLDPPIDRLVQFGYKQNPSLRRKEIPTALKELIACQVRLQKIRSPVKAPSVPPTKGEKSGGEKSARPATPTLTTETSVSPPEDTVKTNVATKTDDPGLAATAPKRLKVSSSSPISSSNFLGLGAKKARESKSARKAAAVGLVGSKKQKVSHTGSGLMLNQVVRLRYVKGFTQAVHTPCGLKDL